MNARIIHTTDYQVSVDKRAGELEELKVVLTADLHPGLQYRLQADGGHGGEDQPGKIPDLVVIAGDIFDNEYEGPG